MECHSGAALGPFIPDAARLRMAVFREWPYLYDGDDAYEQEYLRTYSRHPHSVFVVARAGDRVVGISTGTPLSAETPGIVSTFSEAGLDPGKLFYFGESVLLPEWRGRGIGVAFFREREQWARSVPGIFGAVFCAVDRPAQHPARPLDYVPLDEFWKKRGFLKTRLRTEFEWKETGEPAPSPKSLTFWMKYWDGPVPLELSPSEAKN